MEARCRTQLEEEVMFSPMKSKRLEAAGDVCQWKINQSDWFPPIASWPFYSCQGTKAKFTVTSPDANFSASRSQNQWEDKN